MVLRKESSLTEDTRSLSLVAIIATGVPTLDEILTESLSLLYECFIKRFGVEGAQKIYRGVATAKWCADRIDSAEDKLETAMEKSDKVACASNVIYTAIITASTSKKKHVVQEQV